MRVSARRVGVVLCLSLAALFAHAQVRSARPEFVSVDEPVIALQNVRVIDGTGV